MECLFYNGETACYELLDFDPRGLNKDQIIEKVRKCLDNKGIYGDDVDKALETVYLLEVRHLKKVIDLIKIKMVERINSRQHLNNAINFMENKGIIEDFIEWLPKADRDGMRKFIETETGA